MCWTSPYCNRDTSCTWKSSDKLYDDQTDQSGSNPPEELVEWLPEDGFDDEETGS